MKVARILSAIMAISSIRVDAFLLYGTNLAPYREVASAACPNIALAKYGMRRSTTVASLRMGGAQEAVLRLLSVEDVPAQHTEAVDSLAMEQSREILDSIRVGGEKALIEASFKLGDLKYRDEGYTVMKDELRAAFDGLPADQRGLLQRTADRILAFAMLQRSSISEVTTDIPGGKAGQVLSPVESAGCYAPGGRYPLPSSVLMTACTARAAGVKTVWVASPHPTQVTLAAAHVAGADGLLKVGGAQAVAAMSLGIGAVPKCDVIVGPGNKWVTAAKSLVSQSGTAIDMLAGPSEVVIIADDSADPATVAADLLAQAEHDVEARPILVTTSRALLDRVNEELMLQLKELPLSNGATALEACKNGFAVLVADVDEAVRISDIIAPEHLEIMTSDAMQVSQRCSHYGGLFIGQYAAEVLGDYGSGPNHVLPTAGTARCTGGLSVHTFLRVRTWMRIDSPAAAQGIVGDAVALARLEGLEAHARAAERRIL